MKKTRQLIIVLTVIWIVSISILIIPLTNENKIELEDYYDWVVHYSPNRDKLLVLSDSSGSVLLFDLNLNVLAEFNVFYDMDYYGHPSAFDWYTPIWSLDSTYIVIQGSSKLYVLDGNDLTLKYFFFEESHLGMLSSLSNVNLDKENNLIYPHINGTIRSLNLKTMKHTDLIKLESNNTQVVASSPNGRYLALKCCIGTYPSSHQDLRIYDLELNEFYNVSTQFYPGEHTDNISILFFFAPTKPYIAIMAYNRSSVYEDKNSKFRIFNFETKKYGNEYDFPINKKFGSPYPANKLAWSADSSEIMLVEHGYRWDGPDKDNIFRTFNVLTGVKTSELTMTRGPLHASTIIDYLWISEQDSILVIDYDYSNDKTNLIIQNIDSQELRFYFIIDLIFAYIGILTSFLALAIYIDRQPDFKISLQHSWNNFRGRETQIDSQMPNEDLTKETKRFQIALVVYYGSISFYIGSLVFSDDLEIRIKHSQYMIFTIFSMIDILIILLLIQAFILKNTTDHNGWNRTKIYSRRVVILMLMQKLLMGYQFGSMPVSIFIPVIRSVFIIITLILLINLYYFLVHLDNSEVLRDDIHKREILSYIFMTFIISNMIMFKFIISYT